MPSRHVHGNRSIIDLCLTAGTVTSVTRRSFAHRTETFGFDTQNPWSLPVFRLLFAVPRAYAPLVDSWDARYPGTRRALDRLTQMGFVEYQPGVVINTRTGAPATAQSSPISRYRATASGKRLAREARTDVRVLKDVFPRISTAQMAKVVKFLSAFDLEGAHNRTGVGVPQAAERAGLAPRSARWWVTHLVASGHLVELDNRVADVRELVPAHWRITRMLCRQLRDVIDAFPETAPVTLAVEFRLNRTRFLGDIDPARVGLSGATDFDHDVETQRIIAALLNSPRCASEGVFAIEPRITLSADVGQQPWAFTDKGAETIFYQPDAEMRERSDDGEVARRGIIEYERFQSRRDAWSHIERFLGWIHLTALPFEPAVLRFVVDSEPRVRSYVALIEAFADYCLDHPERMVANPVTLAVSSADRILASADPLDPRVWFRITLPSGRSDNEGMPVLHEPETSPYNDYFARG